MTEFIFKTEPKPYQQQALELAVEYGNYALFMDMGTGKSKVAIDWLVNLKHKLTIIVCPKSVFVEWPKEFKKHCPIDVKLISLHEGSTRDKVKLLKESTRNEYRPIVVLMNYEAFVQPQMKEVIESACKRGSVKAMVLDESHRIKAAGSKTSRFLARMGEYIPYKLLLTGTPLADKPIDIYGQYRFLDPSIFGTNFGNFQARYCVMGGYRGFQVLGYRNLDELQEKIATRAFYVRAEDVQNLPGTRHITRSVKMPTNVREAYENLKDEMVLELGDLDAMSVDNIMVKVMRLHQLANGFVTPDGIERKARPHNTVKRDLFDDVLEDLPREPIVVFYKYNFDLANIKEVCALHDIKVAELNGKKNQLEQWRQGLADVIAVQIQAGNAGIDLTRARIAVYYSLGHSLGQYEQSLKRLHRPGQEENVTYIHTVVSGTIDHFIYTVLRDKKDVSKSVLEELRQWRKTQKQE